MSLSMDDHDRELRRAFFRDGLPIGGGTEDLGQIQADEDARIVAVSGVKNGQDGFMEVSFSSESNLDGPDELDQDASTLYTLGGSETTITFGDLDATGQFVEWGEGEELHVHTRNNTGSVIQSAVTIYYVEERDC